MEVTEPKKTRIHICNIITLNVANCKGYYTFMETDQPSSVNMEILLVQGSEPVISLAALDV